jgi:hypothetical protein
MNLSDNLWISSCADTSALIKNIYSKGNSMGQNLPDAKLVNANGENEAKMTAEWVTLEVSIECANECPTLEIPTSENR